MRGKLPVFQADNHSDPEVRDRDAESKGKAELYADGRRNLKHSEVQVGDSPCEAREDKQLFNPEPFTIVKKTGKL